MATSDRGESNERHSWCKLDAVDRVGFSTLAAVALAVLVAWLLSGCTPAATKPGIVEVPVEVPCVTVVPDVSCPAWPEGEGRARVVEWRARWDEAREAHRVCELATVVLRETLTACTTAP